MWGMSLKLDAIRLAAFSRLFSSTVFREMATAGRSPLFARLASEAFTKHQQASVVSVRDAFELALRSLQTGVNRDEYVYKAAVTQRILLGRHTLRSACMLNEFRVGQCKADLVILNGSATVYEIKSERDSLSRLERQLQTYQTVFPRRYVIAGENHVAAVLASTPVDVGVLQLSSRHSISTVREARERLDLVQPAAVFDAIRTDDAVSLLKNLHVEVPDVPNTKMRSELRVLFSSIEPQEFYPDFLNVLKRSRNLSTLGELIAELPASLHAAALTVRVKRASHENVVAAVNSGFDDALGWA